MLIMSNPQLSIVIPAFCEASNIIPFIRSVSLELAKTSYSYELVFVDDGSTDSTWTQISKAASEGASIRALRLSRNFGKEAAIAAGLEYALGQAVIVMDADLQHPPSLVPQMLRLWQEGNQIVEAIKEKRQAEPALKRIFSKLYYVLFSQLSGVNIQHTSDFKLLDRNVIDQWKQFGERQLFFRGCIGWLGFPSATLRYTPAARHSGTTKWPLTKLIKLAITSITSYSAKPLVLIWIFSFLFFILSLGLMIKILFLYFQNQTIPGFFTVYFLQLITGSLILFALALISTYLQQIFSEIKNRPRYIIQDKIDLLK